MTDAAPVLHPAREDLDDLVVLRRGLYGHDAGPRPLAVPTALRQAALDAGALVVVDAEGVPVVRLEDLEPVGDSHVTGRPAWLGEASARPFEGLHLDGPVDLSGRDVVLVDAPDAVPPTVPDDTYLLVLASTSLDGPSAGTDTVRAALAAVHGDASRLGVVPVPREDPGRRLDLLATLRLDPAEVRRAEPRDDDHGSRRPRGGPPGVAVLLTGLSGSGKSTVARAVSTRLVEDGTPVTLLDGDLVRRHLTAGLGFSEEDRRTNVLRIGWVAAEVAHHGGVAVCSPIAPEDAVRRAVADLVAERGGRFVLVHVATPLEECERRDRKGLYAAARRGEIPDFTGISAPYDVPEDPDLRIDTTGRSVAECADAVLEVLHAVRAGGAGDA